MPTNESIAKIAETFKILGHPVRIKMLLLIRNSALRKLSVNEIHTSLGISQPEASKHLILMKNQGLLMCERQDGFSFYKINDEQPLLATILTQVKKND